jgi:putative redox protein
MNNTDSKMALPDGVVEVSETGAGFFQQAVQLGRHNLIADEPVRAGGMDSGPSPYELLLASLGTCTAMTVRLYAERKQIALTHVSVRLSHDRLHGSDAAGEPAQSLERITREIHLEGDLTEAERARLMQIADHCPVHRTLTGRLEIVTEAPV